MISILLVSLISCAIGDFECIDDTQFKHFTSDTAFVIQSCPRGFCFTRNPKLKNPCIGKDRALQIDGGVVGSAVVASAPVASVVPVVVSSNSPDPVQTACPTITETITVTATQ